MKKVFTVLCAVFMLAGCGNYYEEFQGAKITKKQFVPAHKEETTWCITTMVGNVPTTTCYDDSVTIPDTYYLTIKKGNRTENIKVSKETYNSFKVGEKVYFDKQNKIKKALE
jgi:hypothetical protein